jgi:hypothetical protein
MVRFATSKEICPTRHPKGSLRSGQISRSDASSTAHEDGAVTFACLAPLTNLALSTHLLQVAEAARVLGVARECISGGSIRSYSPCHGSVARRRSDMRRCVNASAPLCSPADVPKYRV